MKPRGTSGKREALLADAARAESGGDLAGAALILERILRSEPMHANALRSLAAIRLREGRAADAEPILRRLLARHPKDPGGLVNLGIALRMLGRFDEARVPLETAVDSPAAPVEAFDALGSLQAAGGDHESAAATFRRAVEAHPSVAATWSNLGLALLRNAGAKDGSARAECYDEAVDACRRAIELDPSEASAWNNLGSIERDRGRAGDAVSAYRRAIEAAPRTAEARTNLAGVLRESGHLAEALASAESAVVRAPGRAVLHSNLLYAMNFADSIPEERIFEAHAAFGRRFGTGEVFSEGERRARLRELFAAGRPVRIGFVSPDFRRHSVASFIEPLLASLDRDRFECFAYSDVAREDDTTRRLRGLVPHWRPIHGHRDDQVADEIADDSIEILVDLAGHTAGNRMPVFARRAGLLRLLQAGSDRAASPCRLGPSGLRELQLGGEDHADHDRLLGCGASRGSGLSSALEGPWARRLLRRESDRRVVRGSGHRRRSAGSPRQDRGSARTPGALRRDRRRARHLPLPRHDHHLRGAGDGSSGHLARRRLASEPRGREPARGDRRGGDGGCRSFCVCEVGDSIAHASIAKRRRGQQATLGDGIGVRTCVRRGFILMLTRENAPPRLHALGCPAGSTRDGIRPSQPMGVNPA
jgi:Flp pilus assembly protein TadD